MAAQNTFSSSFLILNWFHEIFQKKNAMDDDDDVDFCKKNDHKMKALF